MTSRDLLTEAFQDLGILAAGEALSNSDAVFGLAKLARLLDAWNAERAAIYATELTPFTLVPNLDPHTIGPSSATFTVTQRPVSIDGANLILNTGGSLAIHRPLAIRDAEWWRSLPTPALATDIPLNLYYNPNWPNGEIHLWPVPDVAYQIELQLRIVLSALTLGATISFPPGYYSALVLSLEELIAPAYPPATAPTGAAAQARARIFGNNDRLPRLQTADAGMPSGMSSTRTTWNYRDGLNG